MSDFAEFDIDREMDRLQRELHAIPEQMDKARTRALRKTGAWIRTRVKKDVAKSKRVPQKSISKRFYISRIPPGKEKVTVWIGTYAVDPFAVGTPSQVGQKTYGGKKARSQLAGVRVGKRFYRGAFIGRIYSHRQKIWIRKSSKFYSPELYPTKNSGKAMTSAHLKHRFPVVRAGINIADDVEKFAKKYQPEINREFIKKMEQELKYETRYAGI